MPYVEAAVLVPLLRAAEGDRLVMVVRREGGVHGGQLGFPGGKREPGDATLLDTAVREAAEETGLDPAGVVILACLPVVETRTTGFLVAPFLAQIHRPARWQPQPSEVAEVIEAPVGVLAAPDARGETMLDFPTWPQPRLTPYFALGEHRVWGLTYRVLEPLLPRLMAGEWGP
jgi:8-oxo-dGTP pyrophosphatase MutT (NUDIX family)